MTSCAKVQTGSRRFCPTAASHDRRPQIQLCVGSDTTQAVAKIQRYCGRPKCLRCRQLLHCTISIGTTAVAQALQLRGSVDGGSYPPFRRQPKLVRRPVMEIELEG